MKHLFTITVLLSASCGRALGDPASDERELTQLVKDINRAVLKADTEFLERVLHPDYAHHGTRGYAEDRSQYLDNRKAGRVRYEVLVWDEIKARPYGDVAIVTGRATARGKDQQGPFDDQRIFTRVFLRRDGRWQLVHSQATPIQKP
jgi:ketosteroid isomerase-like protein